MHSNVHLLVCDLDNTLYNWVDYFVSSFYAMVDKTVEITGCDRDILLNDFRKVHQRYHDSEHPFSLLETETILNLYPNYTKASLAKQLDPALHAFNSKRKETLRLHLGVREGLDLLADSNVIVVAHTESNLFAVKDRLTRLDLAKYFRRIYCRERAQSLHPDPTKGDSWLDDFPMDRVVELSRHQRKPDASVLKEICSDEGVEPRVSAYVGDSIARDITMAKDANVFAIWAKYGSKHDPEQYEKLVRISHWTKQDVFREKRLRDKAKHIQPDWTAESSFKDVTTALLGKHVA